MDQRTTILAGCCWILLALCLLFGCTDQGPAQETPLLLVTVDTLRPDHLGCYGYPRPTSPQLDRLAREGHLFLDAWCPMPTTTPSHASIFTGRYPSDLGVMMNGSQLPLEAVTLAEVLADNGYDTAAFVGAYPVQARFGFYQGFQAYSGPKDLSRKADQVVDEAIHWLAGRKGGRFFLWVHLWDPHTPYYAPDEYRKRFNVSARSLPTEFAFLEHPEEMTEELVQETLAAYDAEISWVDHNLGRLLAALKQHGFYRPAIVAITSDHGESMAELLHSRDYAFDHGEFLYRHQMAVPLVIKPPPEAHPAGPTRHTTPVSLLDLMPTLLDLLGLESPEASEGRSLEPLTSGSDLPPRAVIAQRRLFLKPPYPFLAGEQYSVTHDGWHLITDPGGSHELFDLVNDPEEQVNQFGDQGEVAQQMLEMLQRWQELQKSGSPVLPGQDPLVRQRLRALGYTE